MSKKKGQGHYCRVCGRHRANEKFSGKGHAQHICKDCAREQKATARQRRKDINATAEAGLPKPRNNPMTKTQAASYLKITPAAFDYRRKKLGLEPSGTYQGKNGVGYLYSLETVIAVSEYGKAAAPLESQADIQQTD